MNKAKKSADELKELIVRRMEHELGRPLHTEVRSHIEVTPREQGKVPNWAGEYYDPKSLDVAEAFSRARAAVAEHYDLA